MDEKEFKEKRAQALSSVAEIAEWKARAEMGVLGNLMPSSAIDTAISQIAELAILASKVEGKQNTDARGLGFSLKRDVMDLIETLHRVTTKKEPATARQ